MKNGTAYAKKLKQAYAKFRGKGEAPVESDGGDPVEQLILAVLSQETTMSRAHRAFKRINDTLVDLNDLRISTPAEISETISRYIPRSVQRAKVLLKVLDAVYQREYAVTLQSLRSMGIREVKQQFETMEGVTPYVAGSVILWSLGGHAIPVNDPTLEWLRRQDLVHPNADVSDVQSFLERHISAADARQFCVDLEVESAGRESGGAGKKRAPATGKKTSSKSKTSTRRSSKQADKTKKKTPRKTARTKR